LTQRNPTQKNKAFSKLFPCHNHAKSRVALNNPCSATPTVGDRVVDCSFRNKNRKKMEEEKVSKKAKALTVIGECGKPYVLKILFAHEPKNFELLMVTKNSEKDTVSMYLSSRK